MIDIINNLEKMTLEPRVFAITLHDNFDRARFLGLETGYTYEEALQKVFRRAELAFPFDWTAFKPILFTSEKIKDLALRFPSAKTTFVPKVMDLKIDLMPETKDKSALMKIVIESPASETIIETLKGMFTENELKFIKDQIKENGNVTKRKKQRKDGEDSSVVQ